MKQSNEIVTINTKTMDCDGTRDGIPGHPRIFLDMGEKTEIACPYCGKTFKYNPDHNANTA